MNYKKLLELSGKHINFPCTNTNFIKTLLLHLFFFNILIFSLKSNIFILKITKITEKPVCVPGNNKSSI